MIFLEIINEKSKRLCEKSHGLPSQVDKLEAWSATYWLHEIG